MRLSQLLQLPGGPGHDLVRHGLALDTVVTRATNPGAAFTSFTATTGDSLQVRNFAPTDTCRLIGAVRRGATSGGFRVRSPLMHDNVRGYQFITGETPSLHSIPAEIAEPLYAQDVLIAEGTGGAAETDLGILMLYYSNLIGAQARLHSYGDFAANVQHLKPISIAITNSATIGNWTDTVITTTENLLKANTDYAILGYMTDTALGAVGIKGSDTSNLRIAGPGSTNVEDTSNWFIQWARWHNLPLIPVFNSANAPSTFISTVDSAASSTANITLLCAQLAPNLTS